MSRSRANIRTAYARTMELSSWKFKTIIINMLRVLMDKVNSMKVQMGNVGREIKILRKNL